jgi:hypothetical protein
MFINSTFTMIMYVIQRTLLIVIFMQCGFYSSGELFDLLLTLGVVNILLKS